MEIYLCGRFAEEFLTRLQADPLLNKYFKDTRLDNERFRRIIYSIVSIINGTEINDIMKEDIKNAHIGMNITLIEYNRLLDILTDALMTVVLTEHDVNHVMRKFESLHDLVIEQEIVTNIDKDIKKLEYMKKRASSDFSV